MGFSYFPLISITLSGRLDYAQGCLASTILSGWRQLGWPVGAAFFVSI